MSFNSAISLVVFVMTLIITSSTITFARDFIVGDDSGWNVGVDYRAWAANKQFHVGDRLVFKYSEDEHNVYKVNGAEFRNCNLPVQGRPLETGNDTITLSTPGNKWYICGIDMHCTSGQKLVITVLPNAQPPSLAPDAPAPTVQLPWITSPTPAPHSSEAIEDYVD